MAFKVFTNGSVLNASDLNDYLMTQSVMVFSNATARASALTSPTEGMITYLEDTNKVQLYTTSWNDLVTPSADNVVSTTKTDTFSSSSSSLTNITGLSAVITPRFTTSRILVDVNIGQVDANGTDRLIFGVTRGGTQIGQGAAAGSRSRASSVFGGFGADYDGSTSFSFLDSPASTSALTYQVQGACITTPGTFYVNRSNTDSDGASTARASSTITVTEILA
jgi:hypothetical protein